MKLPNSVAAIVGELVGAGLPVLFTGSRCTKYFHDGSDYDFVVYSKKTLDWTILLKDYIWSCGDGVSEVDGRAFESRKTNVKGPLSWDDSYKVNLIIVHDMAQWDKWIMATRLIRIINPETKERRIEIFDTVFDDKAETRTVAW